MGAALRDFVEPRRRVTAMGVNDVIHKYQIKSPEGIPRTGEIHISTRVP
jgi:hypothetical protein